jgi:dihydroxyacid dehydratase/phosphogluconate dehydratase
MLRAVGFGDADFGKPQIGVASTWARLTPCNMHIRELAEEAVAGVDGAGGKSVLFNTITVSDGISMGSPGMRYSLVSREVIADSIETVVAAEGFDGVVAIGGCDKNMPGCAMAIARSTARVSSSTAAPSARVPAAARHRHGVRGHRRARRRRRSMMPARRGRAHRHPGRGQLRRHVHRQYHGLGHRGARAVAAEQLRPGSGR